ncbi:MAG: hypothetical protein GY772_01995 [bacterium]|nr:hypothetical protein [bacterium]
MTHYSEIRGVDFAFEMDYESCAETGASGYEARDVSVEETVEPHEAMSYWLGWDDERQNAYIDGLPGWEVPPRLRTWEAAGDLPQVVYDALILDLNRRIEALGDDLLGEVIMDQYEPPTFSTWD